MLPVLLPLAVDGCPDLIFTAFNKKCLLVFQNAQPQAWHQGHLWRTDEGLVMGARPGSERVLKESKENFPGDCRNQGGFLEEMVLGRSWRN